MFSYIELQMLRSCFLIHIIIIILRHILCLVFICVLLWDQFFNFSFIFIVINYITSLKQTHLLFVYILEFLLLFFDDNLNEESEWFSNSKSWASGCCLVFAWLLPISAWTCLWKCCLQKNVYSSFINLQGT